jgi:hypothetical protein
VDLGEAQARGTLSSRFASGQRDAAIRSRTSACGPDDPHHEEDSEETVSGGQTWRMLSLEECRLQLVGNSPSVMWSGSHGRRSGGIAPKSTSKSIASIVTGSLRRGDWEGCTERSQRAEHAGHRGGRPDRDWLGLRASSARTNTKAKIEANRELRNMISYEDLCHRRLHMDRNRSQICAAGRPAPMSQVWLAYGLGVADMASQSYL